MDSLMTRRRFFQALAASVAVAGLPLPIGFPSPKTINEVDGYYTGMILIFTNGKSIGRFSPIVEYEGGRIKLGNPLLEPPMANDTFTIISQLT